MIRSIRIKKYSFYTGDIVINNLGSITCLVGDNGSGKSLIIKAISSLMGELLLGSPTDRLEINLELELYDSVRSNRFHYEFTRFGREDDYKIVEKLLRNGDMIFTRDRNKINFYFGSSATIPTELECYSVIFIINNFEGNLTGCCDEFFNNFLHPIVDIFDENSKIREGNLVSRLLNSRTSMITSDREYKLIAVLDAEEILSDVFGFSPPFWSDGIIDLEMTIRKVINDGRLTLLDNVEGDLFYQSIYKLIGLIDTYSQCKQFVLSTNSSETINQIRPESIRIIKNINGDITVDSLSAFEISAANLFLREEGTMSDFIETIIRN